MAEKDENFRKAKDTLRKLEIDKWNKDRVPFNNYLLSKRDDIREAAFNYSESRTTPVQRKLLNPFTKDLWQSKMQSIIKDLNKLYSEIQKSNTTGFLKNAMLASIKNKLNKVLAEYDEGYKDQIDASSCLLTATDNYVLALQDLSYSHASNELFLQEHPGFTLIPIELALRGDIVLMLGDDGIAGHAAIYAGIDNTGKYSFNNSNGGIRPEDYVKGIHFTTVNTDAERGDPNAHLNTLTFTGTPLWELLQYDIYNREHPELLFANGGHLFQEGGFTEEDYLKYQELNKLQARGNITKELVEWLKANTNAARAFENSEERRRQLALILAEEARKKREAMQEPQEPRTGISKEMYDVANELSRRLINNNLILGELLHNKAMLLQKNKVNLYKSLVNASDLALNAVTLGTVSWPLIGANFLVDGLLLANDILENKSKITGLASLGFDTLGALGKADILLNIPRYGNTLDAIADLSGKTWSIVDSANDIADIALDVSDLKDGAGVTFTPFLHNTLATVGKKSLDSKANGGHLFDGGTEDTQLMNDATYVAPIRVPNLGELKVITGGLPLGSAGQVIGLTLVNTSDYIPFAQLLKGLGYYLLTPLPTDEELKLINQLKHEEAIKRSQEHPYASAAIAALLGLEDGFLTGTAFLEPINGGSAQINFGSEAAIKASKWYIDLVNKVGLEKADNIVKTIQTPEFIKYFFGEDANATKKLASLYLTLKNLIDKLTGNVDEGKAALAGFPSINKSGTSSRSGAVLHDIDLSAYIESPSKMPTEEFNAKYPRGTNQVARQIRKEVLTENAIADSPFLLILKQEYPEEFGQLTVRTMTPTDIKRSRLRGAIERVSSKYKIPIPDFIKNIVYTPYKSGVIEINPLINRSPFGTNRFTRTKINGQEVDIFFSDAELPQRVGSNTMDANTTLGWKQHFIDSKTSRGLKPRDKDVKDLENYVEFSAQNPIIDEATGNVLYSPVNFLGSLLITEEGLPYLGEVLPYPGADHTIKTFMNTDGTFWPIKADGGFINSLLDLEQSNIHYLKHTNSLPEVRYDDGGKLEYDKLSIRDKAAIIKLYVGLGYRDIASIRDAYNQSI